MAQSALAKQLTHMLAASYDGYRQLADACSALADRMKQLGTSPAAEKAMSAATTLDGQLAAIQSGAPAAPGLGPVNRDSARFFGMLGSGDASPGERLRAAVTETCETLTRVLADWHQIAAQGVPSRSAQSTAQELASLPNGGAIPASPPCGRQEPV